MNPFLKHLEESAKIKPSVTKGYIRVSKSGKITKVDPFLTLRKVMHSGGDTEIHFEKGKNPIKMHGIISTLHDPKVSKKFKKLLMHHLEVTYSNKVKYAKIESKDGKLTLSINPRYIHKKNK